MMQNVNTFPANYADDIAANEHYYRLIPDDMIDIKKLKMDLDIGINHILDGLDALTNDDNDRAMDLIVLGLSALSYNEYLTT